MSEPTAASVPDIVVEDNPIESRYEARIGDRVVGISEYELPDEAGPIVFVHTEVMPDAEGQGVGSRLARGALDDVRRRRLSVVADCPFIAAYIRRHPEYRDLLAI